MSELHLEAHISRRLAPQAASAPWASDEIASQCLATNFVAWSLTSAKSPPTRVRHRARSGSPLQLAGDPRYRLILPAKRTNAQSAFAVLQADNLNTAAIRSGPSCSSWIASDKRTYLSDFAEMLAPAEKKRLSAEIEISRGGATRFKNIGDNSPQTRRHSRFARRISNRWFKSVTAARLHLSTPSSHNGPRGGLRRRRFNFRGASGG